MMHHHVLPSSAGKNRRIFPEVSESDGARTRKSSIISGHCFIERAEQPLPLTALHAFGPCGIPRRWYRPAAVGCSGNSGQNVVLCRQWAAQTEQQLAQANETAPTRTAPVRAGKERLGSLSWRSRLWASSRARARPLWHSLCVRPASNSTSEWVRLERLRAAAFSRR